MEKYKIGTFANYMGVSVDLVKHYQSTGIIRPYVDANNRYRYYDIRHGERLIVSKKFRNLDFSVEESNALTSKLDGTNINAMLCKKQEELLHQLNKIKQQYESVLHMQKICNLFLEHKDEIFECERPGYYFCKHTIDLKFNQEVKKEVIKEMMNALPTSVKLMQIPFQEMMYGETMIVNHGLALPEECIDLVDQSLQHQFIYVPPKNAVLYVYSKKYSKRKQPYFRELYHSLVEKGYPLAKKDIYVENGIDFYEGGQRIENYLIYFEKNENE